MNPSPRAFVRALESWYAAHGRHTLPWRKTTDPYAIWVSEVMLQQTQVKRVADHYYAKFLAKYPTVESLAESNWKALYPYWKGLGFYGRGRRMLQTARVIVEQHAGQFPQDVTLLAGLPGIGQYTSAAIMSFAFDAPFAAIDTNLERVITALWPNENIAKMGQLLINESTSSRVTNNALMDLATALRSGQPLAGGLADFFSDEARAQFKPKRKKTTKKPQKKSRKHVIEVGAACIWQNGKYLLQTRPEGKSFAGRWEFPGGKREKGEDMRACVKREVQEELGIDVSVRPVFCKTVHEFDRVRLVLNFHRCQIQSGTPSPREGQKLEWATVAEFPQYELLETNSDAVKKLTAMRPPSAH